MAAAAHTLLPASAAKAAAGGAQQKSGKLGALGAGHVGNQLVVLEGATFMQPCVMPAANSGDALWLQLQLDPVAGRS